MEHETFQTVMAGHSFVRGFKNAMVGGRPASHEDVSDPVTAARFAEKLEITTRYHGLYTQAKNMVFIADLRRDLQQIFQKNPDSILVNVGSNDLATLRPDYSVQQVKELAAELRDFVHFQVPSHIIVVCMGVVPRLQGIHTSPAQFREAARLFNEELQSFETDALAGVEPTNFRYNRMRGWDQQEVNNQGAIQQLDLEVEAWCNDRGIHPRHHVYMDKFAKSVKRALTMSKNRPILRH